MPMKLTNRVVAALPVPAKGKARPFIRDTEVVGFGVKLTPNGKRSFALKYVRKSDGIERYLTIGEFGPWEVGPAREQARRLRREIDGGGDPLGQLEETRAAPTVADLAERFIAEHLPRKRPHTAADYKRIIAADILPRLGALKVAAVAYGDIDKLHRDISKRAPIAANRTLAILSKMFTLSIRWGIRPDNPVRGIERNDEDKRQRYLSDDELSRLMAALERYTNRQAADAIRLLLLTGARKTEVLTAQWSQFDLDTGTWVKPGSAVKQKRAHVVPLNAPAIELLRRLPRRGDYLFPATRSDATRPNQNGLAGSWSKICKDAKISGLRIHDLRHHFASVLASSGASLPLIGQLLGHSQPATTARYAHLFDSAQRKATEAAGQIISGK